MRSAQLIFVAALMAVPASAQTADNQEFFETKIRPVLASQCFACHTDSNLGDLRVDSREELLAGGKTGPAIVPGKPDESLLIRAVRHDDSKLKMPMGGKLSEEQIADLTHWVKAGAPWPEMKVKSAPAAKSFTLTPEKRNFWSFQPIQKPALPNVAHAEWAKSPIDRFVLAKLEGQRLAPVKAADKRTLIRRASFDLIGLPPTPEEVDAFVADKSPDAFAKVVDSLLASPHYGERWGRHWLDIARYADGDGRTGEGAPPSDAYANTWRYRDWVIASLNRDMPYDTFVKAQIAGDLLDPNDREKLVPGLGLFGLGPWGAGTQVSFQEGRAAERDDRIDVVSRGFLGLTVACARCHDHKYDPISQADYYALGGVFANTEYKEYLISSEEEVTRYKEHQAKIRRINGKVREFLSEQEKALREVLARQTSRYMMAAWTILRASPAETDTAKVAADKQIDAETLHRWLGYLRESNREHPYLKDWDALIAKGGGNEEEARKLADGFQELVLEVMAEKTALDEQNEVASNNYKPAENAERAVLPGNEIVYDNFCEDCKLVFKPIERTKFRIWIELFVVQSGLSEFEPREYAVFQYKGDALLRFLGPEFKRHVELLRAEVAALKADSPPPYTYLMGITEKDKAVNLRLNIRGSVENLGDEVPRGFPAVLANTDGKPRAFTQGSGRLELADAIVNHPLTARVIANRVWMYHFGRGIVSTPSNFGQLGDRPTHPELLEYLAHFLRENQWSLKALHREIMLSATYQLSSENSEQAAAVDPDNRLLWRMNWRRLDAEVIRDSILSLAGTLDETLGGPPLELDAKNHRATVYAQIRRTKPDGLLTLFDFPNPRLTSEMRVTTNVPLQGLFFLNSEFILNQARAFAKRLDAEGGSDAREKITRAYRLLYGRDPSVNEIDAGLDFVGEPRSDASLASAPAKPQPSAWESYVQVLLSSNELLYVN